MRILVTGAQGMLGHEVVRVFEKAGHDVIAADIMPEGTYLDITEPAAIRKALISERPDWLINCAAYTNVDACEDHEDQAFSLNAQGPEYLAQACSRFGVSLLHVSTDYVFDGTKNDPYSEHDLPHPINAYGRSKLAGEYAIRTGTREYIIVRPQWLFGIHGHNFVATIIEIARNHEKIHVVNDQWGSPTYANDLAKAMMILVELDARGTYHLCNRGRATWYDLAKKAVEFAELDTEVVPVSSQEFPRPAKRPANSILSTKKFTEITGKLMPLWQISLEKYVQHYLVQSRKTSQA
ncbi:MAG: dTDP-4-dehydrorhamnose reductase [Desulfomonilia bacterium]|nr:dTDP-4-dehydrorhamnose reductase [Desulfomonilia bacterium]